MKPIAESGKANNYLTRFLLIMFWIKEKLYRHCFWTTL